MDLVQRSSQVVQSKFHIDEIVDSNKNIRPRQGKDGRKARKGRGRRDRSKKKGEKSLEYDESSSYSEPSNYESSSAEEGAHTPLRVRTRPRKSKYEGSKKPKPCNPYLNLHCLMEFTA